MLNKLLAFIRKQGLIAPGDQITCAVSGGADSVALLFALHLLKDKLDIRLSAAHFNHHLRGAESDRDEDFVREFCGRYDIPLTVGQGNVVPGEKGLEAAARDARYAFLRSLPGKIATAHTADDNAETVLMHLVRGTGLKGLGGIAPQNGSVIRPLLSVTRQEVEDFCAEWCLHYVTDSSNEGDAFLRNRLRHHVMPLLKQENPAFSENTSAMALRLRQDEEFLSRESGMEAMDVDVLRRMHPALRSRALEAFLKSSGVREPEKSHIAQAEALVFSEKPSSHARFPGGIVITRRYGTLEAMAESPAPDSVNLPCPGSVSWGDYRITAETAENLENSRDSFTVAPLGEITIRSRQTGDTLRLSGGTKTLKKILIDRKIPASWRDRLPVLNDGQGVLAVYEIGVNLDRAAQRLPAVRIHIEKITNLPEGK